MKTNKPPAFQFYADDFVSGVSDMTQSEVGSYILLLCWQWNRGEIPTDKERAALIAKGQVTDHVLSKFPNGKNPRLESVRKERETWVEKSRIGGKTSQSIRKGGLTTLATKWQPPLQPPLQPTPQPNGNTPTPSPSPSPIKERKHALAPFSEIPSWDEFWDYCKSLHCGLASEFYAKDKWEAANQVNWSKMQDWRAYARRCKTWWDQDGRPMKPTNRDGKDLLKQRVAGAPARQEVNSFASNWADEKQKDKAKALSIAIGFYQFWNDDKRAWAKSGSALDWKSELQIQLAKKC